MSGKRIPSYRLHKPSGRAVGSFNGKIYYLGRLPAGGGAVTEIYAETAGRSRGVWRLRWDSICESGGLYQWQCVTRRLCGRHDAADLGASRTEHVPKRRLPACREVSWGGKTRSGTTSRDTSGPPTQARPPDRRLVRRITWVRW